MQCPRCVARRDITGTHRTDGADGDSVHGQPVMCTRCAQNWTTRRITGTHRTDGADGRSRSGTTRRTGAHRAGLANPLLPTPPAADPHRTVPAIEFFDRLPAKLVAEFQGCGPRRSRPSRRASPPTCRHQRTPAAAPRRRRRAPLRHQHADAYRRPDGIAGTPAGLAGERIPLVVCLHDNDADGDPHTRGRCRGTRRGGIGATDHSFGTCSTRRCRTPDAAPAPDRPVVGVGSRGQADSCHADAGPHHAAADIGGTIALGTSCG